MNRHKNFNKNKKHPKRKSHKVQISNNRDKIINNNDNKKSLNFSKLSEDEDETNVENIVKTKLHSEIIKQNECISAKSIANVNENSTKNRAAIQEPEKLMNNTRNNKTCHSLIMELLTSNHSSLPSTSVLCNAEIKKGIPKKETLNLHNRNEEFRQFAVAPNLRLQNFQTLINQNLTEDIETSDDDDEFIEYVFKPRQYYLYSLCQLCNDPSKNSLIACKICQLSYYCTEKHMGDDDSHMEMCSALSEIAKKRGGHIFENCKNLNAEEFRTYRVTVLNACESVLKRELLPFEKEIILFPRICCNNQCRQWRELKNCEKCGQVAFCKDMPDHFNISHLEWCKSLILLRKLIVFQEKHGKIEPNLPTKVFDKPFQCATKMEQVLKKIYGNTRDIEDDCYYSSVTQIASAPLTAWYGAKLSGLLDKPKLVVHLIGAELQFEVDVLHKWELFFLHITPTLKDLHIVFIGPELNNESLSLEPFTKFKPCKSCRKREKLVRYYFENNLYHNYLKVSSALTPDLICFFNPGLHRLTGFNVRDTWPESIKVAADQRCPIIITSYTQYESPLDFKRFLKESQRNINILMPPTSNPFSSQKPERNFISDEYAPLIFKNFYCFVVQ